MKALFTYNYGKEKMNKIKELGYEVIYINEKEVCNNENINDIDVLVCYNPFENIDMQQFKKLKLIQLSSIGIDQAPIDYIRKNNIMLSNNKGGYSIPIGEWIILKILEIYKNSLYFYKKQENREWKINTSLLELYNKNVGFIGTGTIAIEAAKRLQGFGVDVYGLNTNGRDVEYFDKCFSMDNMDEFLSECDVVVVSIPYTKKTHHLIDGEVIDKMKDGCVLINIARGSIINELDLIDKIKQGKFLGVALDVFEREPLSKESPLWDLENVILTPHNCWISENRNNRRFEVIYENLKRLKDKEDLINLVNLSKGY
ncbi:phosphoglycerate dehydrogenase [Tepidibacter hydrothermalis]|uniref:Phosphoglycerate dehydrogenase n=1 Tax=Tepidibacter hydrothermalis TaxID=3036126 RepID=A0ABY8EHD6_9FIRM|nr:phosphoglycerate dehydrogenase [Tepidibacter hydrothermalis]WFD10999.1 phosphoglycerate dehydrogenase [Tepidibacter hydrothermalis]